MEIKLFDSELKVMEILWKEGDLSAGQLAKVLKEQIGWNRNTTYTVIKKCMEKGALERFEPNFMCHALIERKEAQHYETRELIEKMFDGSREKFFSAFLEEEELLPDEIERLKQLIERRK